MSEEKEKEQEQEIEKGHSECKEGCSSRSATDRLGRMATPKDRTRPVLRLSSHAPLYVKSSPPPRSPSTRHHHSSIGNDTVKTLGGHQNDQNNIDNYGGDHHYHRHHADVSFQALHSREDTSQHALAYPTTTSQSLALVSPSSNGAATRSSREGEGEEATVISGAPVSYTHLRAHET